MTEAARRSRIARSTLQFWLARGRAGEPEFRQLVRAIDRAKEEAAMLLEARAARTWRASRASSQTH